MDTFIPALVFLACIVSFALGVGRLDRVGILRMWD